MSCNVKISVSVSSSFKPLHHDKAKCKLIDSIIKDLSEIADQMESVHPKKTKLCWHNCLCYEVECCFAHTYTIEARKKIKKVVVKAEKVHKINGEIAKLGDNGFEKSWEIIKTVFIWDEYMAKLIFVIFIIF